MSEVIFENEHVVVERMRGARVLVVTRRPTKVDDPSELVRIYRDAMEATATSDRGSGLVLDLRSALGRNDGRFEQALEPLRRAMARHFHRSVFLVASASGALQIRRLAQSDKVEVFVTHDYDEAVALATPR